VELDQEAASVSIDRTESHPVVVLRGSFNIALAKVLHEAALQIAETAGRVVIDCKEVVHLDGCAVQVLLALKLALESHGGSIQLKGASEEVLKYLGWAGLSSHFPIDTPGDVDVVIEERINWTASSCSEG